jgi:steroid delta-isomerase-like uncharacterized protein
MPLTQDLARTVIRRWETEVNAHNVTGVATLYAPDAVLTSPMFKTTGGRGSIAASFDVLFSRFPDWKVEVSTILVDGDQVAALTTASATDRSGAFGLPATGQPFSYRCVLLYTICDGRIMREERIYDLTAVIDRLQKVRVERELRAAADVQRALFPRETQAGEYYEAVGDSIPCRAIGGDFFDCFVLPGQRFGVVLGDVSGKGPAAALLASLIQGMVAMETNRWQGPGAALAELNEALIRRGIEPRFATLSCAMLTMDGHLTYANAGHNPPLLVMDEWIRPLSAGGPVLGVFANARFEEETVRLRSGDRLVVFSDGVTEALNAEAEEFGDSRLLACVEANRHLHPGALVAGVLKAVAQFRGETEHSDDATLMVLRYIQPPNIALEPTARASSS